MDYSDFIPHLHSETDSDDDEDDNQDDISMSDCSIPCLITDSESELSEGELHSDVETTESPFEVVESGEVITNTGVNASSNTTEECDVSQEEGDGHLNDHDTNATMLDSDSDDDDNDGDDSDWSTVDETSDSDSSTDDYDERFMFSMSEESSLADDEEYGLLNLLSQQFELFNNVAPSFFGVSLQLLYDRLVESLETDEETPTPQHIIDSLPISKVTLAQVASNMSCCICFGEYTVNEDLLKLPCTHFYHQTCIMNWLKMKSTCPTCRLDLSQQNSDDKVPTRTSDTIVETNSSNNEPLINNVNDLQADHNNHIELFTEDEGDPSQRQPQRSSLRNSSYTTAVEEKNCLSNEQEICSNVDKTNTSLNTLSSTKYTTNNPTNSAVEEKTDRLQHCTNVATCQSSPHELNSLDDIDDISCPCELKCSRTQQEGRITSTSSTTQTTFVESNIISTPYPPNSEFSTSNETEIW